MATAKEVESTPGRKKDEKFYNECFGKFFDKAENLDKVQISHDPFLKQFGMKTPKTSVKQF